MTPRRLVASIALAAGVIGVPAVAVAADEASDIIIDAVPAPGSVIAASPERLIIAFAEPVADVSIRVFDESGEQRAVAVSAPKGSVVEATPELLDRGRYLMAWEAEGELSGRRSGAYSFAIDPSGTGAIVIDRQVTGSAEATTIRRLGIGIAGVGWVLLAGSLVAAALRPDRGSRQAAGWGGGLMAGGAALAFAGTGGGFDGSSLTSAIDTAEGRAWLVALVASLGVPYLVLQWGGDPEAPRQTGWRLIGAATVATAAVATVIGIAAEGVPALLAAGSGAAAATAVAAAMLGQRMVAAIGAVVVVGLVALVVVQTGDDSVVHRDDLGPVVLEVAVDPARRGVNELHLYGFDARGGLAELGETTAWVTHVPTGVGPMEIPLLRAGPNHFLTYGAELPLAGTWEIEMHTSTQDAVDLETTAVIVLR